MSGTVWREPAEESLDMYPGLVVWDDRRTGSITIGRTRLPVQIVACTAINETWDYVCDDYNVDKTFTQSNLIDFLYHLFEVRGEFARLLLVLANSERLEAEREDAALAPHGPIVNITPGDPDAVQLPPSWWQDTELSAPVVDQLRRCLAALGGAP